MKKKDTKTRIDRLLVSVPIGILLGIVLFYLSNYATAGEFSGWCAVTGLMAGLLFVSLSMGAQYFSLYKRSLKTADELENRSYQDNHNETYDERRLDPFLKAEMNAADRENKPVSIIMADLDHYNTINDTYGQIVGDHIIAIFTQAVLKCLRPTDIITQYSGDALIVILPDTDTATAAAIAEKIRSGVANTYVPPVDNVVVSSIHCSVGVATYPVLNDNASSPVRCSEIALYAAKASGRDCVRVYRHEMAIG